jgi:transcriptional regulator with XRE-family HTH domain
MVGRTKKKLLSKKTVTVHQVVAYNFRRAREEKGWTQAQTSDALVPYLGYRLNQAGVSAVEKTFDSDRRRNLDVAEVVAYSRCFGRPIGWFFLPPPGYGDHEIEPVDNAGAETFELAAVDLAALVVGTPRGAASFRDRISELLETDADETWRSMQLAFEGGKGAGWEKQIDLRRRALQQATLARFAGPEDDVIMGMAALLIELVKTTPVGFAELREKNPDEALELLAEGDELVRPLIAQAKQRRADGVKTGRAFDDLEEIDDLRAALRPATEEG